MILVRRIERVKNLNSLMILRNRIINQSNRRQINRPKRKIKNKKMIRMIRKGIKRIKGRKRRKRRKRRRRIILERSLHKIFRRRKILLR